MSAEIAVWEPQNLDQAVLLSQRLSKSGLVPDKLRGKPDDILLVLMAGHELGFSPVQSLRSFYVINGRLAIYADATVAVCVGKPVCKYFRLIESNAKVATYETVREGSEPVRLSYTIEQAVRAKLTSNQTYQAHTEAMLRARCAAALARVVYPDLVAGLYDPSELEEPVIQSSPAVSRPVLQTGQPQVTPMAVAIGQPQGIQGIHIEPVTGEVLEYEEESQEPLFPGVESERVYTQPAHDERMKALAAEPIRVGFGQHKGKALGDLTDNQIGGFIKLATENLANPEKARWHEEQRTWIANLEAEILKRGAHT